MRNICLLFFVALCLASCNHQPEFATLKELIEPDKLPAQALVINVSRDTTVRTFGGAILKIPAGALDGHGAATVQLSIQEAYTIRDIVRGGLLTYSKGRPLASGGMINILPVDSAVSIKKPIPVSIPAMPLRDSMQVFKGVEDGKDGVDWVDPRPLFYPFLVQI